MKLPIPIILDDGRIIVEADLKPVSTGGVADCKMMMEKGKAYQALLNWIQEGVAAYVTAEGERIEDRLEIKRYTNFVPMRTGEMLAVYICLEIDMDDGIEGYYVCPRCKTPTTAELSENVDTRDRIEDLEKVYMQEPYTDVIKLNLTQPVIIKAKSKITKEEYTIQIDSIEMKHPTLKNCIDSHGKYGVAPEDAVRRQFVIYLEALKKLNDEDVSLSDKAAYGLKIFLDMGRADMRELSKLVSVYGMKNTVKKSCLKCGKEWACEVDTSNFFASAMQ